MAYLRGRSYVDGDLVVEGTLQVRNFTLTDGQILFHPSTGGIKKYYLVRFDDENGALGASSLEFYSGESDVDYTNITIRNRNVMILSNTTGAGEGHAVDNILTITRNNVGAVTSASFGSSSLAVNKVTVYDAGLKLVNGVWIVDV